MTAEISREPLPLCSGNRCGRSVICNAYSTLSSYISCFYRLCTRRGWALLSTSGRQPPPDTVMDYKKCYRFTVLLNETKYLYVNLFSWFYFTVLRNLYSYARKNVFGTERIGCRAMQTTTTKSFCSSCSEQATIRYPCQPMKSLMSKRKVS